MNSTRASSIRPALVSNKRNPAYDARGAVRSRASRSSRVSSVQVAAFRWSSWSCSTSFMPFASGGLSDSAYFSRFDLRVSDRLQFWWKCVNVNKEDCKKFKPLASELLDTHVDWISWIQSTWNVIYFQMFIAFCRDTDHRCDRLTALAHEFTNEWIEGAAVGPTSKASSGATCATYSNISD